MRVGLVGVAEASPFAPTAWCWARSSRALHPAPGAIVPWGADADHAPGFPGGAVREVRGAADGR